MKETHPRGNEPICPLCGTDRIKAQPHYAKLYGHYVCRKCYHGFANRRQFAFAIDTVLWILVFSFFAHAIGAALRISHAPSEITSVASHILFWVYGATFLFKDGFKGMSPGKAAMGVCVIDETTGEPAGRMTSSKRNLPLLVPAAPGRQVGEHEGDLEEV